MNYFMVLILLACIVRGDLNSAHKDFLKCT